LERSKVLISPLQEQNTSAAHNGYFRYPIPIKSFTVWYRGDKDAGEQFLKMHRTKFDFIFSFVRQEDYHTNPGYRGFYGEYGTGFNTMAKPGI
jgi:hypothetical protein